MIDKANGVSFPSGNMTLSAEKNEILTLETPNAEEIAKAIWKRQHAALPAESLSYHKKWRDQSISPRFWNEFLLDARAVILLLHEKHDDFRMREAENIETPIGHSRVAPPLLGTAPGIGHPREAHFPTVHREGD